MNASFSESVACIGEMGHRDGLRTEAEGTQTATIPAAQPPRSSGNSFLKSWAWKREHRPDRDRFELPYKHKLVLGGNECTLIINQRPFKTTGFASTGDKARQLVFHSIVWDSAIVLSKYLERWPSLVTCKRCLELGAGCGLAGIVSASLGAKEVVLTDLPENLSLLSENALANKVSNIVSVEALVWGYKPSHLRPPYDIIIATDIMYIIEALNPLINTMRDLSGAKTTILLAYGRNRRAEELFMSKIEPHFLVEQVAESALDEVYQCIDVDVYKLQLKSS